MNLIARKYLEKHAAGFSSAILTPLFKNFGKSMGRSGRDIASRAVSGFMPGAAMGGAAGFMLPEQHHDIMGRAVDPGLRGRLSSAFSGALMGGAAGAMGNAAFGKSRTKLTPKSPAPSNTPKQPAPQPQPTNKKTPKNVKNSPVKSPGSDNVGYAPDPRVVMPGPAPVQPFFNQVLDDGVQSARNFAGNTMNNLKARMKGPAFEKYMIPGIGIPALAGMGYYGLNTMTKEGAADNMNSHNKIAQKAIERYRRTKQANWLLPLGALGIGAGVMAAGAGKLFNSNMNPLKGAFDKINFGQAAGQPAGK